MRQLGGLNRLNKNKKGHTFKNKGCVWSDQERNGSRSPDRSGWTLRIDCNITCKHDSVSSVPTRALYPVDGVQNSSRRPITSVLAVDSFDVVVARGSEKVHERCLDRLGLVDESLRPDVEATDAARINVVLLEKGGHCGESEGVDIFAVVREGEVLLPEADRVLALGDAVEVLQRVNGDALYQ